MLHVLGHQGFHAFEALDVCLGVLRRIHFVHVLQEGGHPASHVAHLRNGIAMVTPLEHAQVAFQLILENEVAQLRICAERLEIKLAVKALQVSLGARMQFLGTGLRLIVPFAVVLGLHAKVRLEHGALGHVAFEDFFEEGGQAFILGFGFRFRGWGLCSFGYFGFGSGCGGFIGGPAGHQEEAGKRQ